MDILRLLVLGWLFPDPYQRNVEKYRQARASWPPAPTQHRPHRPRHHG